MAQTLVLNEQTVFVVPVDRQTFFSIKRFKVPIATAVVSNSINVALAKFLSKLDKGFGVFALTRAWWLRIKRAVKSFKLKFEAMNYDAQLISDSKTCSAEVEAHRSTPVRTRTRPSVRHHPSVVAKKSFFRRR
jgi:hypothetical protein